MRLRELVDLLVVVEDDGNEDDNGNEEDVGAQKFLHDVPINPSDSDRPHCLLHPCSQTLAYVCIFTCIFHCWG